MKKLITLIFLIIIIFALAVGASALTLKADAEQLATSFTTLKNDLASTNYGAAISSAQDTQSAITRLSDDLDSPIWDVVSYFPVVGEDIRGLKTIATALKAFSKEGITPVVTALQHLNSSGSSYTEKLSALQELASATGQAQTAVGTCINTIKTVPKMHIPILQENVSGTLSKLSSVSGSL